MLTTIVNLVKAPLHADDNFQLSCPGFDDWVKLVCRVKTTDNIEFLCNLPGLIVVQLERGETHGRRKQQLEFFPDIATSYI